MIVPETIVCDHGKAYLSATFRSACRSLGISLAPAHPDTPTDKPVIERTLGSVSTLFAQYVAGYVGRSIEHRGKDAEQAAVWSMAELQALLDEWVVAVWQNRPHEGLRDPLAPGKALTPNERYAALVAVAGYVPVPLGPEDYIELLPATWRVINSYGVKIGLRTYDSGELNPYRRQHSGIDGPATACGRSATTPTTSPGSGSATTTTAAGWPRPGHTCAPPRPRSASWPGPTPGSCWPPAAATPPPKPRSPRRPRTCSTAPARAPGPGRANRQRSRTRQPAARAHRGPGGSPGGPRPPLPRSGPARPAGDEDSAGRPMAGLSSRPRPEARARRRR